MMFNNNNFKMTYSEKNKFRGGDLIKFLKEEMAEALYEFENLKAKNTLSPAENLRKNELAGIMTEIDAELAPLLEKENQQIKKFKMNKSNNFRGSNPYEEGTHTRDEAQGASPVFSFSIKKKKSTNTRHGPISRWVLENFDVPEAAQSARVEDVLAALCTGQPKNAATAAAMMTMKSVTGTALLTEFLSAQLWETGISKSHLANSGMQSFLMDEPTVRFPKIVTYPDLEWKPENAQTTDRTVTIEGVQRTAKTLRGFCTVSGELMQDGHGIGGAIRRAFAVSVGNSVDEAGLAGTGDGDDQPLGIINYSNASEFSHGQADIESFDPLLYTIKAILDNDGEVPDTSIMSPKTWLAIQLLKTDSELNPLNPPPALVGHMYKETTKMPNDKIVMGNFRSLHLGIRLNTQVIISPVLSDTFQHNILGVFRGEFFPEREQDFGVLSYLAT
jgi:HK97 family phage major capsid protein